MHSDGTLEIAVLAFGSLLAHPGDWLGGQMARLIRHDTPFSVEYAGRAFQRRGGAPTMVRCNTGGIVRGGLIVLPLNNNEENIASVRQNLALREGLTKGSSSKIKEEQIAGFHVIYADFDAALTPAQLNGKSLAAYAIASVEQCVRKGYAFNNGIRYLRDNLEWGIITPLTEQYVKAILQSTHRTTLAEAEHKLLTEAMCLPRSTSHPE